MIRWPLRCALALMVAPLAGAAQGTTGAACPAALPRGNSRFAAAGADNLTGTFDLVLVPPLGAADSTRHAVLVLRRPDPAVPALRVELADTTRHVVGEQPVLWGYLSEGTQLFWTDPAPADPAHPGARLTADGQLLIGHVRGGGVVALKITHLTPTGFRGEWLPPPTITPGTPVHGRFCATRR